MVLLVTEMEKVRVDVTKGKQGQNGVNKRLAVVLVENLLLVLANKSRKGRVLSLASRKGLVEGHHVGHTLSIGSRAQVLKS